MIKLLAFLGTLLFSPIILAEDQVVTQNEQPMNLDLSVPQRDLEYKPDATKKAYQESKEEEEKRQHCADLSRQIDALKGKFKPARRSALINKHRAECLQKGTWQEGPN